MHNLADKFVGYARELNGKMGKLACAVERLGRVEEKHMLFLIRIDSIKDVRPPPLSECSDQPRVVRVVSCVAYEGSVVAPQATSGEIDRLLASHAALQEAHQAAKDEIQCPLDKYALALPPIKLHASGPHALWLTRVCRVVVLSLVVRRVCVVSHACGECRYIAAKRKYEALMANKDLAKVRADAVPLGLVRVVVWAQTRAHTCRADCWSSRDGTPCTGSRTPSRASSRSPTRSRPSTPHARASDAHTIALTRAGDAGSGRWARGMG